MKELRPGVWHWTAAHPEWTTEDEHAGHLWGPEVSSYAFSLEDRVVLVDPVTPAEGLGELLADRRATTVLTCPWHARDAARIGLPVFAADSEPGHDLPPDTTSYVAGDTLDFGVRAYAGLESIDLVLWIEAHQALVFGDTLVDLGAGLELPDDWGPQTASHDEVRRSLRSLLDLPFELVLPTHGSPTDRAAFERAVS